MMLGGETNRLIGICEIQSVPVEPERRKGYGAADSYDFFVQNT